MSQNAHLRLARLTHASQSFADIAQASSEQLQKLPGVGQVKAKRIQDAFRKPFRNHATSSLSAQLMTTHLSQAKQDKGKGKASDVSGITDMAASVQTSGASSGPPRNQSPVWDIELDLSIPSPPPTSTAKDLGTRTSTSPRAEAGTSSIDPSTSRRKRPPSPVWDIELDLNESDVEEGRPAPSKKTRAGGFGDPLFLQETP